MRWRLVLSGLILVATLSAQKFFKRTPDMLKVYARVTVLHLQAQLAAPFTDLHQFDARNFAYALYPTAAVGTNGMVPGDTATGAPMIINVRGGIYDHHMDATPVEFDITNSTLATRLEHAPGQIAQVVFGVLYTGAASANCTGVIDVIEMNRGHLILQDQVTYDCRGGGSAEFDNDNHRLTVRSAHFAVGDQPCCPSTFDVVQLHLNGESIKAEDVSTIDN